MHDSLGSFAENIDPIFCFLCFSTVKKPQHDGDDDSAMGPSISTDRKTTTLSEVYLSTTFFFLYLNPNLPSIGSSGSGAKGT